MESISDVEIYLFSVVLDTNGWLIQLSGGSKKMKKNLFTIFTSKISILNSPRALVVLKVLS